MGSPAGERGRKEDEVRHEVTLTTAFCMKATEVTRGEWSAVAGKPIEQSPRYCEGDQCPQGMVSWWDAAAWCNTLSAAQNLGPCYGLSNCTGTMGIDLVCATTGLVLPCDGYRLPSEAEWEYAARAGTTTATYNGDPDADHQLCEMPNPVTNPIGWYCGNAPGRTDMPVASKLPNAWGLWDMLGGNEEWTGDWYGPYPEGAVVDPMGPSTGERKTTRGGQFMSGAVGLRAAYRFHYIDIAARKTQVGFRPVRSLVP